MFRLGFQLGFFGLYLAALLLGGGLPAKAGAAWLGYRNDTKAAVIVQSASVVNNVVRRGKPHSLAAGQFAWDWVAQANTKIVITVYDAKQPARVLYQGPVMAGATDLFFAVQLEPGGIGPRGIMLPPRVKMVQAKPTTSPPANPPAATITTGGTMPATPTKPRR